MSHDGTGTAWTTTDPTDSEGRNLGGQEIRDLRKGIGFRIDKEHVTLAVKGAASSTGTDGGGEHKKGSARAYYQSGDPSNSPDGSTALDSSDDGRISLDTADNTLRVYTGSAFIDIVAASVLANGITTASITNDAVDKDKIAADVAGNGLGQNADGSLEAKVDDSTIELDSDSLRLKDNGTTAAKLAVDYRPYLLYREEQSSGDNGGDLLNDAEAHAGDAGWNLRGNWTEKHDTASLGSTTTTQVTLPAGDYEVRAEAVAFDVNLNRLRLWDDSNEAILLMGMSRKAISGQNAEIIATLVGRFSLSGSTNLELHHYVSTSKVGTGKGQATTSEGAEAEIYATLEFWRVEDT